MISTQPSAIKDKAKKTTTKPVASQKKKNGASTQLSSSVSRTDIEGEEDGPAAVTTATTANVKANGTRLAPGYQRLRQRKPVAATATATTKVSSGSGAAPRQTGTSQKRV
jgi:hypothetical protein